MWGVRSKGSFGADRNMFWNVYLIGQQSIANGRVRSGEWTRSRVGSRAESKVLGCSIYKKTYRSFTEMRECSTCFGSLWRGEG